MAVYQMTGEGLGPRGLYQPIPAQPWLLWGGNWRSCCSTCRGIKSSLFPRVLSSAYSPLNELLKWHLIAQFAPKGAA